MKKNTLILSGKSKNNNSFFVTKITCNDSYIKKSVNEGNFNIIVPAKDKFYNIETTFFTNKPSSNSNIDLNDIKSEVFPYNKYNIPAEVWLCVYGTIEGQI